MDKTIKIYYISIFIILAVILLLFIPLVIIFNKKPVRQPNNDIIVFPNEKKRALTSIKIVKFPQKLYYKEGELFDKTGMIIKAIYDDKTQTYVDNYIIDKTSPLSLYDSHITFSYKDKKDSIDIKIINDDNIEMIKNPSKEIHTLEPIEGFITRFEIEDSDVSNWKASDDGKENIIIESKEASGGKYLNGINEKVSFEGKLIFNLNLKYNAEITMRVSYAQKIIWRDNVNLLPLYTFIIDENRNIEIYGDGHIHPRYEDKMSWEIIQYKTYTLPKGMHTISIRGKANNNFPTPNIDYIDFETKKIKEIPIEPDTEDMPSNDFHTLLQYSYILDEHPENIENYAKGVSDLSRPKGNLINFSDMLKETAYTYVLQISSSENFDSPDTKIIKNLKEKKAIIKNLKLGQRVYYRGAINEENLINSKINVFTTNNLAPRNLDIPGVDNSRDIGGVKTTLVENGIINQGLYYRTAQINSITEEGKKILTEDLGIKVEIDLRDMEYNTGPYVDGVEYYPIPIPSGTESTRFENFQEEYVKIFNLMSEADENPIVLHCTAGADRTGIMTFALMTLLGCEYVDIARDYCFTNFGVQGSRDINSEFTTWWRKLDNYEGDTKAERCKSWLMSKGIEEETLEHIREIFIDGYKKSNELKNYKNENKIGYILAGEDDYR
jgi:protein tyrosine/serine phosphatase